MDDRSRRYETNGDDIAAKVIDGEAIIINLKTGAYYSLDGTGGEVWSLIEARRDVDEVVELVADRYGVDEDRCRSDIESLVEKLLEENLIRPAAAGTAAAVPEFPPAVPYEAPRLDVYRDMGDLLALDPPVPGLEPIPWDDPEREEAPEGR